MRASRPFRAEHGYTLFELIITLAVVAIVAGLAIPMFGNVLSTAQAGGRNASAHQIVQFRTQYNQAGVVHLEDGTGADEGFLIAYADTTGQEMARIYLGENPPVLTGELQLLAGSGDQAITDGTGSAAAFTYPKSVALAGNNLYVAENTDGVIRKVTSTGVVTTFAGGTLGHQDGVGASARFGVISDMATDAAGNLYVLDKYSGENYLRQVTAAGLVSTLAATAIGDRFSGGDLVTGTPFTGTASSLTVDGTNIYLTDSQKIWRYDLGLNIMYNYATSPTPGTTFSAILHVNNGDLYLADSTRVYRYKFATNQLITVAGGATCSLIDGQGVDVGLCGIGELVWHNGNLLVASDSGLVEYTKTGGSRTVLVADGSPSGVAVASNGNLYVAQTTARKISVYTY